jgi:hypothetical protein
MLPDGSERAIKIGRTADFVGIERNAQFGGGGGYFLPVMLF